MHVWVVFFFCFVWKGGGGTDTKSDHYGGRENKAFKFFHKMIGSVCATALQHATAPFTAALSKLSALVTATVGEKMPGNGKDERRFRQKGQIDLKC